MAFEVFHRTWWANNWERTEDGELKWTDGLEPCVGEETVIARHVATEDEARAICKQWNDTHEAGRLSRKAEFSEERQPVRVEDTPMHNTAEIDRMLADPSASYWLKNALRTALAHDALDISHDATVLATLLRRRVDGILVKVMG